MCRAQHVSIFVLTGMTGLTGCAAPAFEWSLPASHPASAMSPASAYAAPPNDLALEADAPAMPVHPPEPMEEPHNHDSGAPPIAKGAEYPLGTCVVSGAELGSMGDPVVINHNGREVRFCCPACVAKFNAEPEVYLNRLDEAAASRPHHPQF